MTKLKAKAKNNEQDFLKSYDSAAFDKPSVAVDVVILTIKDKKLHALLTKRNEHPFLDHWSLIGGFVGMAESIDAAANRVLEHKGNLHEVFLEQLYTFGGVNRDPRMRIISVSYYSLANFEQLSETDVLKLFELNMHQDDETDKSQAGETDLEEDLTILDKQGNQQDLAFDHQEIIAKTVSRIRGKLEYVPIGFELLPERFTLRQIQEVHETILGRKLNKDAFRRKILASKTIEATGDFEQGKGFRPAEYYIYVGD